MARVEEYLARNILNGRIEVRGTEVAAARVDRTIILVARRESDAEEIFCYLDHLLVDDDVASLSYDNGRLKSWRSRPSSAASGDSDQR